MTVAPGVDCQDGRLFEHFHRVEGRQPKEDTFRASDIALILNHVSDLATARDTTPALVIRDLIKLDADEPTSFPRVDRYTAELASKLRRIRLRRNAIVQADLFRDAAWDMLLELFHSQLSGRPLSIKSLCFSSGAPQSTALRQLTRLEAHGLAVRMDDEVDGRGQLVKATPAALDLVGKTLNDLLEAVNVLQNECARTVDQPAVTPY